jgi:hypothetical protein
MGGQPRRNARRPIVMVVVDSSVRIGDLRNDETDGVMKLRALDPMVVDIVVADLVLLEVLRGARDETYANRIERHLSKFGIVDLGGRSLAVAAPVRRRNDPIAWPSPR